jgi:hypothetical protein
MEIVAGPSPTSFLTLKAAARARVSFRDNGGRSAPLLCESRDVSPRLIVAAAVRRWLVTAALLLVFLVVALVLASRPAGYASTARFVLLPPQSTAVNVLAYSNDALTVTAGVVARDMAGKQARERVTALGGDRFAVSAEHRGSEEVPVYDRPVLVVTARCDVQEACLSTTDATAEVLSQTLQRRQLAVGVAYEDLITVTPIAGLGASVAQTGSPVRGFAALGAIAVLVTGAVMAGLARDGQRGPDAPARSVEKARRGVTRLGRALTQRLTGSSRLLAGRRRAGA